MKKRGVIALLLAFVYIAATAADACGVLMCRCSSARHHLHAECCGGGHHHHDDCACDAEDGLPVAFMQHCDCSHNHDAGNIYAASTDTDRILRYIKIFAADMPHMCDDCPVCTERCCEILFRELKIPPTEHPAMSEHAPRAPSARA